MKIRITTLVTALVCAVLLSVTLRAGDKPNILFILSDDLNSMLSGFGHPECQTPNLDKFAGSGVSFTRAFCQFPLCGPSRASIMTGQYPIRNGVDGNGDDPDPDRITLPRHFGNHGYWTARVSKIYHMGIPHAIISGTSGNDHTASWDEAYNILAMETLTPGKVENFTEPDSPDVYPAERERWLKLKAAGTEYDMPSPVRGDFAVVEADDKDAHLLADYMATDKAIELLRERADQPEPFFLAVGYVRPHFPFVTTEGTTRPYDADQIALPANPANDYDDIPKQSIRAKLELEDDDVRKIRRGYYGCIGFMDQQVGRLLAELDRLNLRDNTIVVFVSDHGYLLSEHRMWKKNLLWEEAIRVPLIISAPGMKQGLKCNQIVEHLDLYPTLTELAGLPMESGAQGESLIPLLDNPKSKRPKNDALIQTATGFGLRKGKWAYMWFPVAKKYKEEGFMLYDMETDPCQYTNLADDPDYAKIKNRLHRRLMERIDKAK
jgi:arylsulfatase A-like enzyme